MNAIRFSCSKPVLYDTKFTVPKSFVHMLGAEFLILQPGDIEIKDDMINKNSQIFMVELNSTVKYPK